jgi:hypothetical protein
MRVDVSDERITSIFRIENKSSNKERRERDYDLLIMNLGYEKLEIYAQFGELTESEYRDSHGK